MQKKLAWEAAGFRPKVEHLIGVLEGKREDLPKDALTQFKKVQGYLDELNAIMDAITRIDQVLIPRLEQTFSLEFKKPELVYIALTRPSIRNVFENIRDSYSDTGLRNEELEVLANFGEAGEVLALLGDAVIDLGLVDVLWDSSLATTGNLTKKRQEYASNQNLAKLCDRLGLSDYKIQRIRINEPTKEKVILHEKGTLVEAIFGIVYVEHGYDEVVRTISLIQ